MARIECNVMNCSHNNEGVCYANKISVTGKKAHTSNHTCCSSFLNQSTYNNLTSNVSPNDSCNYIGCNVKTCTYNVSNICSLDNISVTSIADTTNLYAETYCSSFKCK